MISFDFSSVFSCPSTTPLRHALSANHMQRLHSTFAVMRTSLGLAVQGDYLASTERHHIFLPTREAVLKSTHRQRRDNSRNRIVDRHSIGQRNIPAQSLQTYVPS